MNNLPESTGDKIQFTCSSCDRTLRVPAASAGRRARCPHCQSVLEVPAATAPLPVSPFDEAPVETSSVVPASSAPEAPAVAAASAQAFASPPPASAATQQEYSKPTSPAVETETSLLYESIRSEIAKVFVGQDELVEGTLIAIFSGGHVLIESVPGLGKTLFVRTLGKILGCDFGRIQFTADLMPSDITGAPIFNMKTSEFEFHPGPVFTQLLLADEINRSPAKTHAALLEIMQEKRVTVDGTTHMLDLPFLVLATQNPLESEGTYSLPEAQLDRFMFKLIADYPSEEQEAKILAMHGGQSSVDKTLEDDIQTLTNPEQINRLTNLNSEIRVDPLLVGYINKIVRQTRRWPQFYMGASPRAGISLMQGIRTLAAFQGRDYAIPDDVVHIAKSILRHRVMLTAEAEVEGQQIDQLLDELIRTIEVPRIK